MEVVGVIAGVPGLIQIIQAVTTAVRGISKKDVAPKIARNLIQSLQELEKVLEDGKQQGLWDERHFEQHKSTIEQWKKELGALNNVLQRSNLEREPRRALKKCFYILTDLEKRLNEWSTRLTQYKTELLSVMISFQQRNLKIPSINANLRADLHPCSATFIPNRTPGTCEWIWSHSTFSDWVKPPPTQPDSYLNRTLCIHGMTGCGKSVLVKSIAQKFQDQGEIILHFSFWSGNDNQRKLGDLLRTLACQVSRLVNYADLEKVSKLLTESNGIDERGLVKAIHTALSSISEKVYCTIDGIDESTEDWNKDTDGCLSTILNLVKCHTNLHVLFAGREASVRTLLKRSGPRLEITEHHIRGDIEKLIAVEIHDSLRNYSPAIRAEAQRDLEAKTQVMFLWVTLVLKELRRCSSVEDVRQTLQQVPHDLDREYHRLFIELMNRTKGTQAKPSISMKRAKHILSSILICPEPMTGEDLCYAYATRANLSGKIEDDLITVDGILDACGDFVRVTEGRFHIIHASASDFLTRSQSEWELEDTGISYFRVDLAEAQESMCLACFRYIKSIDLGYPLTDGDASSLPSRYQFLSYAARYLPFHLTEALQDNEQLRLEATELVTTHHFCALIEYILATSQNFLHADFLYSVYWVAFLAAEVECMKLDRAFILELKRREKDFGAQHWRYQSWLALDCIKTDLLASSVESLPVPMLLLAANVGRQQENSPLPGRLAAIAVRKTRGKGDIFELCSLLSLAAVRYFDNGDTSEATEEMVRESVRIANRFPNRLFVQWWKLRALQILVLMLLGQDRIAEADDFVRMYQDLAGMDQSKSSSRLWDRIGIAHRIDSLEYTTRKVFDQKHYSVSADIAAQGIAILANSSTKPADEYMSLFIIHRSALYQAGEVNECISSCQQLLDFSKKVKSTPFIINVRWITQLLRARCHALKGDLTEADKWFVEAAAEMQLQGADELHLKGQVWHCFMLEELVLLGQYKSCQSMNREVLEVKGISYSDEYEDLGFGPLELLVSKLDGIGSIDSNYMEFLRCHSLLMAEEGLHGSAEKAKWWEKRLSLMYDNVQSFRKRIPLFKLKYIDTYLRQDGGLSNAIIGYRRLGRFFFEHGDTKAADFVSSDAESCIFSELSSHVDPSMAFRLTSDVYRDAGKFSKCKSLLCQAYQMSLQVDGDEVYAFEVETVYASTYLKGVERFEDDLEKIGLRLPFLEKSCEHLSKALKVGDVIDSNKGPGSEEHESVDEPDAAKRRKERSCANAVCDQFMRDDPKWATFSSASITGKVGFHLQNVFLDEPMEDGLTKFVTHIGIMPDPRASYDMVLDAFLNNLPSDPKIIELGARRDELKDGRIEIEAPEMSQRQEYRKHFFYHRPTWDVERQASQESDDEGDEEDEDDCVQPAIELHIPERAQLAKTLCHHIDNLSSSELRDLRIRATCLMTALRSKRETVKYKYIQRTNRARVTPVDNATAPIKGELPGSGLFPVLIENT
ncbi:hypothetical protein FGADI_10676 [Fusarium gaditjirri]|uniref:Nephrocystin 3-like N-terminal domain-containing protein n=1 Tax=Fusarium gaditjirri TaxID=282569 RepID=A0A8H4SWE6_9HYPO|nr:hypothetical protein FGADI_10676 [Fusarium gaditjirri]